MWVRFRTVPDALPVIINTDHVASVASGADFFKGAPSVFLYGSKNNERWHVFGDIAAIALLLEARFH